MTLAQALIAGDRAAVARVARSLLRPQSDNLVARPWGGRTLEAYKGIAAAPGGETGGPWGEAFEMAACELDPETRAHPSRVTLADGSTMVLAELLRHAGPAVLGAAYFAAHGPQLSLLPKTLSIGELLSVQSHPAGYTEAYVIIDCAPGATLRLGFAHALDPAAWGRRLTAGLVAQRALTALLRPDVDALALQARVGPWLCVGEQPGSATRPPELDPWLADRATSPQAQMLLAELRAVYWEALGALNAIPLRPGLVIHNANPPRVAQALGRPPTAEVHALGNPEGREILAFEVRRPGPTYRAWDHVRWPARAVAIDQALAALSFIPTSADEFIVEPRPLAGQPRIWRSVEDDAFVLDHLRPTEGLCVRLEASEQLQLLHALRGVVTIAHDDGTDLGTLSAGASALVPARLGPCRLLARDGTAELLRVHPR
ncbi:MAG: hypothetical protein IPL40_05975 [Proteobacteria bacterium]|nr:hypothetical protein [Pseudomonadota bacterium]